MKNYKKEVLSIKNPSDLDKYLENLSNRLEGLASAPNSKELRELSVEVLMFQSKMDNIILKLVRLLMKRK